MCCHKRPYSNVSLMQHGTVLLKNKCVVTSLLDSVILFLIFQGDVQFVEFYLIKMINSYI